MSFSSRGPRVLPGEWQAGGTDNGSLAGGQAGMSVLCLHGALAQAWSCCFLPFACSAVPGLKALASSFCSFQEVCPQALGRRADPEDAAEGAG